MADLSNGGVINGRWLVEPGGPIAIRGVAGCTSPRCTQPYPRDEYDSCMGWHCGRCGEPSCYQGHLTAVAWWERSDDPTRFGTAVKFPDGESYYSCSPEFEAAVIALKATMGVA